MQVLGIVAKNPGGRTSWRSGQHLPRRQDHRTARRARESGCQVIGIIGSEGPLVDYCDIVLMVETLENTNIYTPTISRIAALTVVDILSTSVALRRGNEHVELFTRMKRNLRHLRMRNEPQK